MIAALVAGGSGSRMGASLPKQFLMLCDKPVLVHTAECFLRHPQTEAVIIGTNPDWIEEARRITKQYFPEKPVYLTEGGSSRNETIVRIIDFAVSVLKCTDDDIVLSHDAVRPFVTQKMIDDSIAAMNRYPICTAAVAETDTVAWTEDGQSAGSFPDRSHVYRIQTPQTFRIGSFREVYSCLSDSEKAAATDVCSLFRQKGFSVGLIEGDRKNIKLTFPDDLQYAEWLYRNEKT